jgi:hypothetical protein
MKEPIFGGGRDDEKTRHRTIFSLASIKSKTAAIDPVQFANSPPSNVVVVGCSKEKTCRIQPNHNFSSKCHGRVDVYMVLAASALTQLHKFIQFLRMSLHL